MAGQNWSLKIITRYSLIQLPGIAIICGILFLIKRWINLPIWFMAAVISFWVVKDVILFFITWRAYDWEQKEPIIGKHGIVIEKLDPEGRITIHGEQWLAEVEKNREYIEKGEKVLVEARKGLKLFVKQNKEK